MPRPAPRLNAAAIENLQRVYEALAFRAQQIRHGNETIGEDDFGGFACTHAEFVFFFAWAESWISLFENEGGYPFRSFGFVGDSHGDAKRRRSGHSS